jgi:hypothetical protein
LQARIAIEWSCKWYGSPSVLEVLHDRQDTRMASYKLSTERPETLAEAIVPAEKFIEAQLDPEARDIDPSILANDGGARVHIASITEADGFRWVRGVFGK